MSKVILVVCDALRNDTAAQCMGYMEHLTAEGKATRYTCIAELPTLSRPLYETIQTGVPVSVHGITSNVTVRESTTPNLFRLAREAGKTTAAAAYHWVCELYVKRPYDLMTDREIDDEAAWIQHGRFYRQDEFPDIELFAAAGMLLQRHYPDYLLIHPMGLDDIGHKHGANSKEYRNQAILQDMILANLLPMASLFGYNVLVTGDHGMSDEGSHGGTTADVREVPLYIIPTEGEALGDTGESVSQLGIAPTICSLLGISPAPAMQAPIRVAR